MTMDRQTILLTVLVVLVVTPVFAPVALAQENQSNETVNETTNATANETAGSDDGDGEGSDSGDDDRVEQVSFFDQPNNQPAVTPEDTGEGAGNASGNESGQANESGEQTLGGLSSESGGGDGNGGPSRSYMDSTSVTDEIVSRIAGLLYAGGEVMIEDGFNDMMGTPYPENSGYQGILGFPEEGGDNNYSSLFHDYFLPKVVPILRFGLYAAIGVTFFYLWPAAPFFGFNIKKMALMIVAGIGLVMVSWELATLFQFGADAMTDHFLPDADDLLNPPGDGNGIGTLESTSGPIGLLLGVSIFGWQAGLALITMQGARQVILSIAPAWLGVILILQWFGPRIVRRVGSVLFWGYIGITYMNVPTAAILGAAHDVAFTFGYDGPVGAAANAGTTMGLFMIGLFLPIMFSGVFFIAPMMVMYQTGGSVAGAARSRINRRFGYGQGEREQRGGGHADPNRHHRSGTTRQTTQCRRAMADGGTTRHSTNTTPMVSDRNQQSTSRSSVRSAIQSSTSTGGTPTERRRRIHNRMNGRHNS